VCGVRRQQPVAIPELKICKFKTRYHSAARQGKIRGRFEARPKPTPPRHDALGLLSLLQRCPELQHGMLSVFCNTVEVQRAADKQTPDLIGLQSMESRYFSVLEQVIDNSIEPAIPSVAFRKTLVGDDLTASPDLSEVASFRMSRELERANNFRSKHLCEVRLKRVRPAWYWKANRFPCPYGIG